MVLGVVGIKGLAHQDPNDKKYDLIERTSVLGENIIEFARLIKKDEITKPLISQIVRSGTSIGANYMEADAGESKKDFKHKLSISRKEAKETMHWLRMIAKACPENQSDCRNLWKECQELVFIFSAIINKSK